MKAYRSDLFTPWAADTSSYRVESCTIARPALTQFCARVVSDLEWIKTNTRTIRQHEDGMIEQLYRRSRALAGLSECFGLEKLQHVFTLLEVACDFGRSLERIDVHSIDYIIVLLADRALVDVAQLEKQGVIDTNLTEVVEECTGYIRHPIDQYLAAQRPAEESNEQTLEEAAASDAPADTSVSAAPQAAPVATVVKTAAPLEPLPPDEPEHLRVPPDKMQLLSSFCDESRENLLEIGRKLVEIEAGADPIKTVNDIFRSVHTIKGNSRLFQIGKIERVAHELETLLDQVRKGTRPVSEALIDVLLDAQSSLGQLIDDVASNGPLVTSVNPLLQALRAILHGETAAASAPIAPVATPVATPTEAAPVSPEGESKAQHVEAEAPAAAGRTKNVESVRVPIDKLDEVLNTASEIFISRIRLHNEVTALNRALVNLKDVVEHRDTSTRAMLVDKGITVEEEMSLSVLSIDEIKRSVEKNVEDLDHLSSRLQAGAMRFRMVPLSSLFGRFPTEVRQIARQLGKKVKLEIKGADTEIDKVLIDSLADPLMHILRNSLDHGIESPEVRVSKGKPETGHIVLSAYYQGSYAVIEVRDDGKGIDCARVLEKAIDRGMVKREEAASVTEEQLFELLCEPGFSTAASVTELSGRGVGMDVVKTTVGQMQGSIRVSNNSNGGARVLLKLPLTLAVVGVLLVEEAGHQFAFPILQVEGVVSVGRSDLRTVGDNVLYNYRGHTIPVTTLSQILGVSGSRFADDNLTLVLISDGQRTVGILADRVLGMQEVLIKNLGKLVRKVPFVMGCTILSDSRLVLILSPWEIANFNSQTKPREMFRDQSGINKQRSAFPILVIDDSPIQQKYLSNILDQAGYSPTCSGNGFEALKMVQTTKFAAFCVDISMPIIDGFEFVERLRKLPEYKNTPVLFITGHSAQLDRKESSEFGPCEYFMKPVEPTKLLSTLDGHCIGNYQEPTPQQQEANP